jgi:hypothetical protein
MEKAISKLKELIASLNTLTSKPCDGSEVVTLTSSMAQLAAETVEIIDAEAARVAATDKSGFDVVCAKVEQLHAAALIPAKNYRRIATITSKLQGLAKLASLPQNAALRGQIKDIVQKTAGIFAEVDTVEDLNKPLEQIESTVHKLYGDQSKNSTYNFEARGKGFHGKDK